MAWTKLTASGKLRACARDSDDKEVQVTRRSPIWTPEFPRGSDPDALLAIGRRLWELRGDKSPGAVAETAALTASPAWVKYAAHAQSKANDLEKSLEAGTYTDPRIGQMTLQALYDRVHAELPYAPATVQLHATLWRTLPADMKRRQVRRVTSRSIDDALRKIAAPTMRDKTRVLLNTVFNAGMQMDPPAVAENPARAKQRPRTRSQKMEAAALSEANRKTSRRYLSSDRERTRLLTAMEGTHPRYTALVDVMLHLGPRPGEAMALLVGDFDPLKRTLTISKSVAGPTKTGESRVVPVPSALCDRLVGHVARWSDPADPSAPLFPNRLGNRPDPEDFRRTFAKVTAQAGLPGLTPNGMRHAAAAWNISLGASVHAVQQLLGHRTPSVTLDVYSTLWDRGDEQLAGRQDEALRREREIETPTAQVIAIGSR